MPIFDGPMREWLEWAVSNGGPGQTRLFVWEDGRPFTERIFTIDGTRRVSAPA